MILGMRHQPTMLPVSSQMPAMSLTEPLGLAGYTPPAATDHRSWGGRHRPDTEGDEAVLEAISRGVIADRHPTFAVRDRTADRRAAHRTEPARPTRGFDLQVTQRHSKRPSAFSVSVTERVRPWDPATARPSPGPGSRCRCRASVEMPGRQPRARRRTRCAARAPDDHRHRVRRRSRILRAGGLRRGRRSALRRCAAR